MVSGAGHARATRRLRPNCESRAVGSPATDLVGTYNDLAELMTLAGEGRVTLHTTAYALDAVNEAMDDLETGRLHGRGILVPAGP